MKTLKLSSFLLLCILLNSFTSSAQSESDPGIDSLSQIIIEVFKKDDVALIESYLVTMDDVNYLLEMHKDKMSESDLQRAQAEMDSVPVEARRKWKRKYKRIRENTDTVINNWSKVKFIRSEIEIQKDEAVPLSIAHVEAFFTYKKKTYSLFYDCIYMPRGLVLGNKLRFQLEE